MGNWGIDYDGFQNANSKRKHPIQHDRHGRVIPRNPSHDLPMRRFIENVDPHAFEQALDAVGSEKYMFFLMELHDPSFANLTFMTLARKHSITLQEMQTVYTDYQRHMGLIRLSNHVPQVMDNVGEDAENTKALCARCDGTKVLIEVLERDEAGKAVRTESRTCPVCDGEGKVKQQGDKHARDLVFESMKLTGQKGTLIAINQNFGASDGLDAKMEGMMKMTQQITMGEKSIPDAQVHVHEHQSNTP